MSFGYSVGDVIGGANLAYQLLRIMADTQGASEEYQGAMTELGAMQQAFIQVGQMKSHSMLPQATINAASHIVMSSMDTIEKFLQRTKQYQRQLSNPYDRGLQSSWYKVGWTLYKAQELRTLRDSLHSRLTSVNTLLAAASYCHPLPAAIARYQVVDASLNETTDHDHAEYGVKDSEATLRDGASENSHLPEPRHPTPSTAQNSSGTSAADKFFNNPKSPLKPTKPSYMSTSLSYESVGGVAELPQELRQTESPRLPQSTGPPHTRDSQLEEIRDLITSLGTKLMPEPGEERLPIRFKDAVGRKFSFPWVLCKTWQGMEDLIKQAFLHVSVIGPEVEEGHYDIIGPNGEIILPSVWEKVIEPDWAITMHMWPMDKSPIRPPGSIPGRRSQARPLQSADRPQPDQRIQERNRRPGIYEERSHQPLTAGPHQPAPQDTTARDSPNLVGASRPSLPQSSHAPGHKSPGIIHDKLSRPGDLNCVVEGEKLKDGRVYQEEAEDRNDLWPQEFVRRMRLKGKITKLNAAMVLRALCEEKIMARYEANKGIKRLRLIRESEFEAQFGALVETIDGSGKQSILRDSFSEETGDSVTVEGVAAWEECSEGDSSFTEDDEQEGTETTRSTSIDGSGNNTEDSKF